jgi:hypothetical protein
MAHLLVIELSGGQDDAVLSAAFGLGHRCTFAGVDPGRHRARADLALLFDRLEAMQALPDDGLLWPGAIAAMHRRDPFDAIVCFDPARQIDSARAARTLGLRHAAPDRVALCDDPPTLRARWAQAGIAQPLFERIDPDAEALAPRVLEAVTWVGLPAIIRPGAGQAAIVLEDGHALGLWQRLVRMVARGPRDYGGGAAAEGPLLIERFLAGPVLGCIALCGEGSLRLLGICDTMPGGASVITHDGQFAVLETWLGRLFDVIRLDCAVVRVDCVMTGSGPQPVTVRPLLDGDTMALLGAALGRSVYADWIALHLTGAVPPRAKAARHAVARWLHAETHGVLDRIAWPRDPGPVSIITHARPGDVVQPAQRVGMAIATGTDRAQAELLASRVVLEARVKVRPGGVEPASGTG